MLCFVMKEEAYNGRPKDYLISRGPLGGRCKESDLPGEMREPQRLKMVIPRPVTMNRRFHVLRESGSETSSFGDGMQRNGSELPLGAQPSGGCVVPRLE